MLQLLNVKVWLTPDLQEKGYPDFINYNFGSKDTGLPIPIKKINSLNYFPFNLKEFFNLISNPFSKDNIPTPELSSKIIKREVTFLYKEKKDEKDENSLSKEISSIGGEDVPWEIIREIGNDIIYIDGYRKLTEESLSQFYSLEQETKDNLLETFEKIMGNTIDLDKLTLNKLDYLSYGEHSVLYILLKVMSESFKNKILLLDFPENGLYLVAAQLLMRFLEKIGKEKQLQILFYSLNTDGFIDLMYG